MLEFLLIVFIILLFIFPVLALAVLLRLLTTAVLYRKLYLFGHQLTEGKNILVPNGITQCGNFITSIVMAILSSGVVFILIINNILLFAFNMVFCAFVSLRWFDYTHNMHRDAIRKMNPKLPKSSNRSVFVVCQGLQSGTGLGGGMLPFCTDSGYLSFSKSEIVF